MNAKNFEAREKLARKMEKNGVARASRHLLLCAQSGCCKDGDEAKETQKMLNRARKEWRGTACEISVSSVKCFNLCAAGPILYDATRGVWYGRVTPEVCARILREVIEEEGSLEEFVVAHDKRNAQTGNEKSDPAPQRRLARTRPNDRP